MKILALVAVAIETGLVAIPARLFIAEVLGKYMFSMTFGV